MQMHLDSDCKVKELSECGKRLKGLKSEEPVRRRQTSLESFCHLRCSPYWLLEGFWFPTKNSGLPELPVRVRRTRRLAFGVAQSTPDPVPQLDVPMDGSKMGKSGIATTSILTRCPLYELHGATNTSGPSITPQYISVRAASSIFFEDAWT